MTDQEIDDLRCRLLASKLCLSGDDFRVTDVEHILRCTIGEAYAVLDLLVAEGKIAKRGRLYFRVSIASLVLKLDWRKPIDLSAGPAPVERVA